MAKMPAFQFYPGDWRKDVGVQSLGFFDRGIWFEMLCLMHESEERGLLMLNGVAMTEDDISRALGLDKRVLEKSLTNLLRIGVASRDESTNAVMCRRMVRDERLRNIRKECGKQGGNPKLVKQNRDLLIQDANQTPTPSSSSSSSSSKQKQKPVTPPAVTSTIPAWLLPETWKAFEEMRRKIRAPLTDHARDLVFSKLSRWREEGHDPNEILNQSIMHDWRGLWPVREEANGANHGTANGNFANRAQARSDANDEAARIAIRNINRRHSASAGGGSAGGGESEDAGTLRGEARSIPA